MWRCTIFIPPTEVPNFKKSGAKFVTLTGDPEIDKNRKCKICCLCGFRLRHYPSLAVLRNLLLADMRDQLGPPLIITLRISPSQPEQTRMDVRT